MAGTIYEFCEKFHISLAKARKMEKGGWLRVAGKESPVDEIRLWMTKGQRLTVAMLAELIQNPSGLLELGRYSTKAQAQIDELGNAAEECAPFEVAASILEAYEDVPEAAGIIAQWIKGILPAHPVGHSWVAVRLLLGVPENTRKFDVPRIQRTLMNARKHPELMGCWRIEKQLSRNVTIYEKNSLDL